MKQIIKYTIYSWLYWLFVFAICRVLFFVYNLEISKQVIPKLDIIKSFYKSFEIDNATACYILVPFVLCALLYFITSHKIWTTLIKIEFIITLFIVLCISISDAGLYKEWNAKLNLQALSHFKNPDEVFKTMSVKMGILFLVFLSVLAIPCYTIYTRKIHPILEKSSTSIQKRLLWSLLFFIPYTGLTILGARGGFKEIPTNQSVCLFSKNVFVNDGTINPTYNLLQDATIDTKTIPEKTYRVCSNEEAQTMLHKVYSPTKDTTINILRTPKPNIVFIIVESLSADLVETLGGEKNVMPNLNTLCKQGILCTNAYASAYVSDQGIPAILSAFPGATKISVINQQYKIPLLPCINEELKTMGYTSHFMFGGQLAYGNIRGYIVGKHFDEMKEDVDFPNLPKAALGVHDEYMFPELLKNCATNKEPFFQCLFTQSTHLPFDFTPQDTFKAIHDEQRMYTESAHYTDIQLGKFFSEAKKQTWYNNTLFIVTADHSHPSSFAHDAATANRHKIPILFIGGAIKEEWLGKTIDRNVAQMDIASTILHQLGDSAKRYTWSRNIFNPYYSNETFYVFYGGAGYYTNDGYIGVYNNNHNQLVTNSTDSTFINKNKLSPLMYQQMIYEDFKKR